MHIDSYYAIGKAHTACQDYASHSWLREIAALSDGCSKVYDENDDLINARTDVGARLLVLTALNRQYENYTIEDINKQTITIANEQRKSLDLPKSTLSATLLTLRRDYDKFLASISGDGVICARIRETKQWEFTTYEYITPEGLPLPPTYLVNWLDRIQPQRCTSRTYTQNNESQYHIVAHSGCYIQSYGGEEYYSINEYDTIIMWSDGVHTFTKDSQPIPIDKIMERLLDFKRMKGCFIVRNLIGILQELEKEGITHQDDISAIGIHIDAP